MKKGESFAKAYFIKALSTPMGLPTMLNPSSKTGGSKGALAPDASKILPAARLLADDLNAMIERDNAVNALIDKATDYVQNASEYSHKANDAARRVKALKIERDKLNSKINSLE